MATQNQIFELRIIINDPEDVSSFESYANLAAFPSSGQSGTKCYFAQDTETYYKWDGDAYSQIDEIEFDDSILEMWIDEEASINYAAYKAFSVLRSRTIKENQILSDGTGQESVRFNSLKDVIESYSGLMNFYKDKFEAEENETFGIYVNTSKPEIAGGDI